MKKGYIHVYTGPGKGKTTTALGLGLRAAGAGYKVLMVQFMKGRRYSELNSIENLPNFTFSQHGRDEFVNKEKPEKIDIDLAREGFAFAKEIIEKARQVYGTRDARIEGMSDETTDTYYSCTLCQSFAPTHVCCISPERTGLCGSYNWMDCKAAYEINPTGPNQPVEKGETIDAKFGQWKGVNDFVLQASRGKIDHYNFYSIVNDPMTTCGCCEAIAAVLPLCNGVMTVNRDYTGETPCGMKFTTLAGTIGGGLSTPGFVGHGKYNTTQRKFLSGDGGLLRMVWMPKMLKEEIGERLNLH